ncbi:MAG: sulfite exporter TauE/SafE family protein [bacterium]
MEKQIYKFHIRGMHCKSCVLMTESELKEFPYVSDVTASLKSNSVTVTGEFGERNKSEVAEELNTVLSKHGYTLVPEGLKDAKENKKIKWEEFGIAIPIVILFVGIYIFLQKIGLSGFFSPTKITFSSAFVIGIIASLSSCMAVVGGLVLSMSASFAKDGDKIKPQIMFHVGRIVSFFVLGGLVGVAGSLFRLSGFGMFVISFLIAIVMLILGINLLDVFPWAKRFQIGMPKFLSKHALGVSKLNHTLTPLLVGIVTFFLPCGFTQSMQVYALSTGSFTNGAMIMLSFALGTLPVLALVSFSSLSISNHKNSGIFFKTAGLIVILFAVFNLINALVVFNILPPVFNF